QRYGADAARVVREDPYLAAEQVAGIGFRTADGMAQAPGLAPDDPRPAAGAIPHLVGRAADVGHTDLPRPGLTRPCRGLGVPEPRVGPALRDLSARSLGPLDGDSVYAPPLYAAEVRVANRLGELACRKLVIAQVAVERALAGLAEHTQLAAAQREAVRA